MKIKVSLLRLACLLGRLLITLSSSACAQSDLQRKIAMIAQEAQGTVSVSCLLPGTKLNCDLRPRNHSPMQSMFKYPLALTVLHLAETDKLFPNSEGEAIEQLLNRKARFLAADRIPNTLSPLQDRYPEGSADVSLREFITLTAGQSDNVGSEILLRSAGGPRVIEDYINALLGPGSFQLKSGERAMDRDPRAQYDNWMEPIAAAQLLQRLGQPTASASNQCVLDQSHDGMHDGAKPPSCRPTVGHTSRTSYWNQRLSEWSGISHQQSGVGHLAGRSPSFDRGLYYQRSG